MYKKISFITLIGIILLSSLSFAQIPSPLKDVKVSAIVTLDNITGIYTYSYSIYNPPINDGQIWDFDIDISKSSGSQELSSEGLIIQMKKVDIQGILKTRTFEEIIKDLLLQKPIIPVGTQVPSGWSSGIAIMGTVGWGSTEATRLLPGQTLNNFVIITRGLPTIRDTKMDPDIDYDNLPEEYWENIELTKQLQDSLVYRTKTLGPTAPPADFKPVSFIDYIIFMKHEAFTLGWITNQGIEQSLDAKLENAKMEIAQGNTNTAKNILAAFISEVEAQKDKHLTSEAYGLLKYNAQYLIEKL